MKINIDVIKTMRLIAIALLVLSIALFFSTISSINDYKELKEEIKDIRLDMKIEELKCQIKK